MIALAIIARCSMPPESWCGKASTSRSGSARPISSSSRLTVGSVLPVTRAFVDNERLRHLPTNGHCRVESSRWLLGHIADGFPRSWRSSRSFSDRTSRPPTITEPARTRPATGSSLMMAWPVVVLPLPVSPTIANVSPRGTSKVSSRTARSQFSSTLSPTVSPSTTHSMS